MLSRCLTDWSPWRPKGKELPEPFLRAVGVGFRRSVDYESAIDTVWNYSPAVWLVDSRETDCRVLCSREGLRNTVDSWSNCQRDRHCRAL